jgi:ABC-2 type transport system ATP-binding protein
MTAAIEIRDVTKAFGDKVAVRALSLTVPRASVYGFIGPNGSGKTTTLRMVMNIFLPDRGDIVVLGERSSSKGGHSARDRVSYLPEERGLYKKMTVRELLRYYGRLKSVPRARLDDAIEKWLARMELGDRGESKIETLSKGMSQKVQFISAIVSQPELIILDEPFSGLDPVNADLLKDVVLELRAAGTTIVFSTHDMSAAERLCDRIFMIYRGEKVLDGTLEDIQAQYGSDTIRVRTSAGRAALDGMGGVESVNDLGNSQEVRIKGEPQAFLQALVQKTAVQSFEIARPSLHDIFVRIASPAGAHSASLEAGHE